jgi:glycosyltransferase involved in cell wall biosynthesis
MFEYMALGCVVVASDLPGIRDVVVDGVHGVLVPPGDPDALAEAVDRLLRDVELRERLRAAARARVQLFDAREKVRRVYDAIVEVTV